MAISVVGATATVSTGQANAGELFITPTFHASSTPGTDRVFVFLSGHVGSFIAPNGWKLVYATPYPGIGAQQAAAGPRMQAVFYRDFASGWPAQTFICGADFSGQTAVAATSLTLRKGATEEWNEPFATYGTDATAASPHAVSGQVLPIRAGSCVMLYDAWPATPGTVSTPTLTGTGITSGTVSSRTAVSGTTLGDDIYHALFSAIPTAGAVVAPTRSGAITTARTGATVIVDQDLVPAIDKPIVERITAFENKWDPRTGAPLDWLGADVARSVRIPGTNNLVWLLADTFRRTSGTGIPTTRVGTAFTHSSLAFQTGLDLATAPLTFHWPAGYVDWFPVDADYYTWPQDGIFIGNDFYIFGQRVLASNPIGGEYGWTVHRIPNAKTLPISSWPQATLLYASGNSNIRPIWSPYDGGDGYIYVFAVARSATGSQPAGWRWARWPVSYLTGTQQSLVEWWNGTQWTYGDQNGLCIAENPVTSEGSAHKRASDDRWILTEGTVLLDDVQDMSVRLSDNNDFAIAGPVGYYPPPPGLQQGDYAFDTLNSNALVKVLFVQPNGDRVIKNIGTGAFLTRTAAQLTRTSRSERYVYRNPRGVTDPIPEYNSYALKAHPHLIHKDGLVVSFVDNSSSAALNNDLSIYWPKFLVIKRPVISNLVHNQTTGVVTWTVTGAPDRQFYRVNSGGLVEIDPLVRTVTIPANSHIEIIARGIGGDTSLSSPGFGHLRVGTTLVTELRIGTELISTVA